MSFLQVYYSSLLVLVWKMIVLFLYHSNWHRNKNYARTSGKLLDKSLLIRKLPKCFVVFNLYITNCIYKYTNWNLSDGNIVAQVYYFYYIRTCFDLLYRMFIVTHCAKFQFLIFTPIKILINSHCIIIYHIVWESFNPSRCMYD